MNNMNLIRKSKTHTTSGIISKGIYNIDGKKYLVKGNSEFCKEPFSEVMASIIADEMGLDHIEYKLMEGYKFQLIKRFNCDYVSICEVYNKPLTKYLYFIRNLGIYDSEDEACSLKSYIEVGLSKEHLAKMLLFDAFIGNYDRHFNNFDICYEKLTIKNAPILDNGGSLLADIKFENTMTFEDGNVGPDKAKPFCKTHREQIEYLKLNGVNLYVLEIDDPENLLNRIFNRFEKEVFPYMVNKNKQESVKNYLKVRYREYIEPYLISKSELIWV